MDRLQTLDLLLRVRGGDRAAEDLLLERVYAELHAIADRLFRKEGGSHTLQPTVLVHEAFLDLAGEGVDWESRTHFLCIAAKCMRRVLREHARARGAEKRGGGLRRVTLVDVGRDEAPGLDFDLEALDQALEKLAGLSERQSRVVELRFFADLSIEETARALAVSTGTVENDWRFARAWLLRELQQAG